MNRAKGGGIEYLIFTNPGAGSVIQGEKHRATSGKGEFREFSHGPTFRPEGNAMMMNMGMSMENPAHSLVSRSPLPRGSVLLTNGESVQGMASGPFDNNLGVPLVWKVKIEDDVARISAAPKTLPIEAKGGGGGTIEEFTETYGVDLKDGALRSFQYHCKIAREVDGNRSDETGDIRLEVSNIKKIPSSGLAAIAADLDVWKKMRMDLYKRDADLDSLETPYREFHNRLVKAGSPLAAGVGRLGGIFEGRREAAKNEEKFRESLAAIKGKSVAELLGDALGRDMSGADIKLSDYKGKFIIMNFYASWCGPCNQEIPHLQELLKKHANDGVVVIGFDKETDHAKEIAHARKKEIAWPVVLDCANINEKLNVTAFPTNFFIDRNGNIIDRVIGYGDDLIESIEAMIRKNPPVK